MLLNSTVVCVFQATIVVVNIQRRMTCERGRIVMWSTLYVSVGTLSCLVCCVWTGREQGCRSDETWTLFHYRTNDQWRSAQHHLAVVIITYITYCTYRYVICTP